MAYRYPSSFASSSERPVAPSALAFSSSRRRCCPASRCCSRASIGPPPRRYPYPSVPTSERTDRGPPERSPPRPVDDATDRQPDHRTRRYAAYGERHFARRRARLNVRDQAIRSVWRRTATLRAVAIFLLLGMVPLCLLAYFSTHLSERALRNEVEDQVQTATQVSAAYVEQRMDELI